MFLTRIYTIAALAWALHAGSALATAVWDNGVPNGTGGSDMTGVIQAQDFSILGGTTLTDVRFWNLQASESDYAGSIYWRIVGNTGAGSPDDSNVVAAGLATPTRVDLGTPAGGSLIQNDFSILAPALDAGTYWLELHNGPLDDSEQQVRIAAAASTSSFLWAWTDIGGANAATNRGMERAVAGSSVYTSNGQEHAFVLFGSHAVPEPAAGLLAALGVLALAACRRVEHWSRAPRRRAKR